MKNIALILFFLVVCESVPLFSSPALAELTFTPGIKLREEYNDNIFLTPSQEKEDFITTVNPNINLIYEGNRLKLSLDYGLDVRFYAKNSEQNQQHQRGVIDGNLSIIQDVLFLKVEDSYQRIPIDQRNQVALDSFLVNMTDINRLKVNPYLEFPRSGRFKYKVGYTYENLWYGSSVGDDTENHTLMTGVTMQLSERVSTSLSYSYLVHRPTITDEYDKQDPSLGLSLNITPKLSISGTVGESFFHYVNSSRPDTSNIVWSAQANYRISDLLSLDGGYSEAFSDSVNLGTFKNKSASADIKYVGRVPFHVGFFSTDAKYTSLDREDRSSGLRAGITLPVSTRASLKLAGNYTKFKFLPQDEQADRFSVQATLDYALRITTLSLGYTFNHNDSTINSNDYINNIAFVQAKFTF